ncbi:MAG: hypothetical protein PWP53_752 [Lacrimispora sp.]|jgi:hypothetical protein|nr:hypothetical protein [Lacrimispora sp.]
MKKIFRETARLSKAELFYYDTKIQTGITRLMKWEKMWWS